MFSDRENKIINIIGRKKTTITEISNKLFRCGSKPFDPTIAVANSIRRIEKKCEHYGLSWTLTKSRKDKKLYIKRERV